MVHCFLVKPDQVFFDKKGDLPNQASTYTAVGLLVLCACRGKDWLVAAYFVALILQYEIALNPTEAEKRWRAYSLALLLTDLEKMRRLVSTLSLQSKKQTLLRVNNYCKNHCDSRICTIQEIFEQYFNDISSKENKMVPRMEDIKLRIDRIVSRPLAPSLS